MLEMLFVIGSGMFLSIVIISDTSPRASLFTVVLLPFFPAIPVTFNFSNLFKFPITLAALPPVA
jgi:hypothetical protein